MAPDARGTVIAGLRFLIVGCAVLLPNAVGAASPRVIDVPAGRLADVTARLGMQAGISIAVADPALWQARVAPVRGRMAAGAALRRMLRGTGAQAVQVSADGWRIVRTPLRVARPMAARAPVRTLAPPAPRDPAVDIVVTASKRDTLLSHYAGTVHVLDGGDLALGGVRGTEAILSRLAGVASTHLGSGRNKLFIRGIADSSFTGPTQATVGQYLGDIRLSYNAPDPDLRLYDIARVEVLEGPQGTLYGAGSLGGIIRLMPNAPDPSALALTMAGGVSATRHGAPGGDVGGMANVPLGGGNALRLVGYAVSDGGYIDNPLRGTDDINRTRTVGGRATLRIAPGDGWTVDAGGVIQSTDADDSQYVDRGAPPLTRSSAVEQGAEARYALGTLVVAKTWDGLRFQSSNAVAGHRLDELFDAGRPDDPSRLFAQDNRTRMIASENRLWRPVRDGYGWVLGGSFLDNRTRLNRRFTSPSARALLTGVTNRITEYTLYGEGSVAVRPWLTATAGARYSRARLSGDGEDVAERVVQSLRAVVARRRERDLLPSFGIVANPVADVALFARYQQGFRPGGLSIETDRVRRFRNDRVTTGEAGVRYGQPGRGRFDAALSLSHSRWRNIQADFMDGDGLPSTANIGNGVITSVSLTAAVRPVAGLSFDLGAVFNRSRVTELSPELLAASATERLGRIPNVARHAVRLGADYVAALAPDTALRLSGWANYVGPSRLGIGPVLGERQGDYVDTGLVARLGDARRGLSITVTNLLDDVGNRFALGTPFVTGRNGYLTPMRPQTVRVGLDIAY
ncbi:TonB-dependent receptor domain-containing protein [Sphingomonas montana]|uniref:TonB-dependent receptor domain-containing protein n=1 Tax=Sphingomonas montana TaxID=1843236 RepID=UPI0009F907FD|nr:TonB-dependent receptor [Sphingomonas montana]